MLEYTENVISSKALERLRDLRNISAYSTPLILHCMESTNGEQRKVLWMFVLKKNQFQVFLPKTMHKPRFLALPAKIDAQVQLYEWKFNAKNILFCFFNKMQIFGVECSCVQTTELGLFHVCFRTIYYLISFTVEKVAGYTQVRNRLSCVCTVSTVCTRSSMYVCKSDTWNCMLFDVSTKAKHLTIVAHKTFCDFLTQLPICSYFHSFTDNTKGQSENLL